MSQDNIMIKFCILIISLLLASCAAGPPYVGEIPPLSKIPGVGVSFTIPDENGWHLFDPDGKGSMIVKTGKTKLESYIISLTYNKHTTPLSEAKFRELYETKQTMGWHPPERYKVILSKEEPISSRGKYFNSFYYLVEDHQAKIMPSGEKHMLLEVMAFFAANPNDLTTTVEISYSYRYSPKNKDNKFKEKAKWVLDHALFVKE